MKKTVSFSKNSTNIFFHILTNCNLSCKYCYINQEQHGENTLSIDIINQWLKIFAKRNNQVNIIFLGGEPTLHPDLFLAVKKAKKLGFASITIDTNGYLFNNILTKISPLDVDYFSFSLDGATAETNDKIRGAGSYDKCISGIKKAVLRGFSTSLIYTVNNLNIHELDMMAPILMETGINRFFIQVIGIRGKAGTGNNNLQVSKDKWQRIIPAAAKKIADLGITVTYPKVYLNKNEPFECAGLVADNYFIFPNNRVYKCPLCEDYPIHSRLIADNRLIETDRLNEEDFFQLNIPEGCVMNKIIQPENISYDKDGAPEYKIACCMLKEEIPGY